MLKRIPLEQITPNPDQPRKEFDEAALRELAASIRENGLAQPITVRPIEETAEGHRYMIVMGERRFRAHLILQEQGHASDVLAHVRRMDDTTMAVNAIIENLQRVDVTPIEEARAYQRMLDETGWTVEELARKLGIKQPHRITERTQVLRLREEYLDLFEKRQLTPSQAYELSRHDHANQDRLFRLIKAGKCEGYNALRAASDGLVEAAQQSSMFGEDEAPAPSDEERAVLSRLERRIEQVCALLGQSFKDNEIRIVKKIDPNRADVVADQISLIRRHLDQLERALRQTAAQADLGEAA